MFKWILLILLSLNTFALEILMDSAKDDFSKYSILHINNNKKFTCHEIKDDFDIVTEVVCSFSKKPAHHIQKLENDFFRVTTFIDNDTFFISIKPHFKLYLIPEIFDLTKDNTVYKADIKMTKRWVVLGYKDKLPLINNKPKADNSINFPFFMQKDKLPYVGSLDIKGNPVHVKQVTDVRDYLKVKKYFQEKKYEKCMSLLDDILKNYPNTLFKAELLHYKINLYSKLKDYDNVVSYSKVFLREYSADENVPEILSLIAQAYSEIGMYIDADYFFDRLFSEHKNSVFTQWGYIYKGEMLEAGGGLTKAIFFYKKALYQTKNIDVAVDAAFHLAQAKEDTSKKDAISYIEKILQSKPSFLKQEYKKSKKMMNNFADIKSYAIAAKMALALLNTMDATYDDYEGLLKDRALWLSKTEDKQGALIALNKYIKEFPDGDFIHEIEVAKDALFFETSDLNASSKLLEYDKLIETYSEDTIGNRAIYEKAKLLLSEKRYVDVLGMRDDLLALDNDKYGDIPQLIEDAAIGVMKQSLELKECKEVLVVSSEYNITLSNKWDDGIYECAMKGGNYQLSKTIASKNVNSKDLDLRKKWLFRYVKVDFATGNYSDVIDASKDLISLIEDNKDSPYKEVYRYLFDTYDRLEKKDDMITAMAKIEAQFGLNYKDIERYVALVSIGSNNNDDNMVIKYASMVKKIQTSSNSHAQSPYIEFALYQSYMNQENYNSALEVIKSLDSVKLSNKARSRQKYLLGSVLNKLWRDDEAKQAYKEAITADPQSAWAKLAKSTQSN